MTGPELCITQLPARNLALLQVRGSPDEQLSGLVDRLLVPAVQSTGSQPGPRAYSLGPTEWLLLDIPRRHVMRLLAESGRFLLRVTDISASFSLLRVTGVAAGVVLGGRDFRTRLGHVEVIVQRTGIDSFDLYVDRGVSGYVHAWLRTRWQARCPAVPATPQ